MKEGASATTPRFSSVKLRSQTTSGLASTDFVQDKLQGDCLASWVGQ